MVRAEELHLEKLITSVPEDFRVELRKVVDRDKKLGCNPIDSVSQLVSTINLPKVSAEKKMELLQEATAKKRKKEDARQKALVKVLSAGYPETERLLEIVVKRFGRQKSEATASKWATWKCKSSMFSRRLRGRMSARKCPGPGAEESPAPVGRSWGSRMFRSSGSGTASSTLATAAT